MLVKDISEEPEGVRKPLRACTLLHTHYTMLLRMQHTTLYVGVRAWPMLL